MIQLKLHTDIEVFSIPNEPWMDEGICAQVDPDLWFPEKGSRTREAKQVCMGCPVQEKCLKYALERGERFGIWGGYSERERSRMARGLPPDRDRPVNPVVAQLVDPSRSDPNAHGYTRYRRGCRCGTCQAGNAEYQRLYQESVGNPRKRCQTCGDELSGKGRHRYCSKSCKSEAYHGRKGRAA